MTRRRTAELVDIAKNRTSAHTLRMPTLKNRKHEAFCQQLIRGLAHGWNAGACYSRAGYTAEGNAADVNAARLLRNAQVRARLAELQAATARRTLITVESLCDELEQARLGATSAEQYTAAVQAITTKAKITGKLIDRMEVGGVGEFARYGSNIEVIDALIDQLGDGHDLVGGLRKLVELVEARLADRARALPPAS
jgi:hypothetical protein